jgi:hypothetical protein
MLAYSSRIGTHPVCGNFRRHFRQRLCGWRACRVFARNIALVAAGVLFAAPVLADTYQWSAGEYADPNVYDATTLTYTASITLAAGSSLDVSATDPSNSPGGNSKLFYEVGFTNDGVVNWNTLDPIEFWSSTITNNGQFVMTAATSLQNYAGSSAFINNGTFKDTGGGTVTVPASSAFTFTSNSGGTITASSAGDNILFADGSGGAASISPTRQNSTAQAQMALR